MRAALATALLGLALWGLPAAAQPMLDPAQMSGIPRPDPQVPPGTITVRLIRGSFQNPLTAADVELVNLAKPDDRRTAKTDAAGRATFSGLPAGAYEARASSEGEALASQPIELAASPGIAVMLVFDKSLEEQQKELGTPDGKARVSKDLPGGHLVVQVLDAAGQPASGAVVVVNHGDRATEKVDALPEQKTGADGTARFEGLKTGAGDGYLLTVMREGARVNSKPFRLVETHGSQLTIQVRPATSEQGGLRIANGSHFIIQLSDDVVQVLEILLLKNPLEQVIDPGPRGLRLPLPEGALSPQVLPGEGGNAPPVTIEVGEVGEPGTAVWKGPIPPGNNEVRLAFVLKQEGRLRFRQQVAIEFEALRFILEKAPEIKVEGSGYETEERKFNGKELLLVTGPTPKAGDVIEFTVSGLPYNLPIFRWLAALVALAVALAFAVVARRGRPQQARDEQVMRRRQRLEARRIALLDRLVQIEGQVGRANQGPGREQLLSELEGIYRELEGKEPD